MASIEKAASAMAALRLLTRADEILGKHPPVRETVSTPEWGEGTGVLVQAMTAAQRIAWQHSGAITVRETGTNRVLRKEVDPDWDSTTTLVIATVVDEDGKLVFTFDQLAALEQENAAPIERIADVARRLSGMTVLDAEEGMARLKATTNGESPSDSA